MLARRPQRQRAVIAAIALAAILTGALVVRSDLLGRNLQRAVYDFALTSYPAQVKNQITIVGVDNRTIEKYDQTYPLPRRAYVDLLRALTVTRVRTIALDIAFYDASPDPAADRELVAAVRQAGNVVLAMQGSGDSIGVDGAQRFNALTLPIRELRDAAAGLGAVNILADSDGRVRESQMVVEGPSGERYYALPLVAAIRSLDAARQTVGDERTIVRQPGGLVLPGREPIPDRVLPIDETGGMPIYYVARPSSDLAAQSGPSCTTSEEFCVVSMADVIEGRVAASLFDDRTVLIGFHSVDAVPDNYPTPNSGAAKTWGVEIWANSIQSIFTNRYPLPDQGPLASTLLLALASIAGVLLVARYRLFGFLSALLGLVVVAAAALFLFGARAQDALGDGAIAVPSVGYLLPAVFWWVVTLGYLLVEEQMALARTQSTFGRFVTPAIARTIMEREEAGKLALGGEEKQVTVLFGDIRGFTTMSEGMKPGGLLDTLNRYFDGMVDVVEKYGGTVNKYNGDNIMVLWGAPLDDAEHARHAVACALELQRFIVDERAKGGPDVAFGFGVNSGPVIAGFMGAKGRMEYTVIGDTANVASRLTSGDIARADQIAVSGATLAALGDDVEALDLGEIAVKGRSQRVACFQINRLGTLRSPNPAPPPSRLVGVATVGGYH